MIEHHLTEAQILAYSAGSATEADALMTACHLTLCPHCRHRLESAEAVGGALLEAQSADVDVEGLLSGMAGLLDEPEAQPEPPRYDPDGVLPAPLAAHVGRFSDLPWTWRFPAVEEVVVHGVPSDGMPVRLFRLGAGSRVPDHRHDGREHTLVLTGGFTDDDGHYTRGDLALRDSEGTHRQRIDPGDPCVVLVVADNPLISETIRGWLAGTLHRV